MRLIHKIGLGLSLGAVLVTGAANAQQQFVNVLTGGQSGVYYPMGVALSQIFAKDIPNARSTAQVTKASAENLNLLQAGRGELALSLADSVSDAWKGEAEAGFPKKLDKLRGLSGTYNNYIQIVANADSGIKTLADLKGKRISVGAPKSGTELNARAILKAAGLSYKDFAKVEFLPFGESVELMKNRQLDATLQSAGLGVASIRDLATSVKINVVSIPADVIAKIGDPAYQAGTIPANTYGEHRYLVNVDQCPKYTQCLERQIYTDKGEPDKKAGYDHLVDAPGYFIAKRYPIKTRTGGTRRIGGLA